MVGARTYTAGMNVAEKRLFAPGDGGWPPALAGREQEQAALSLCLSDLERGGSPPYNVVLIGPRGNGKTALLRWFERACRENATRVDVAAVAAADVPDRAALLAELAPPTGISRLLPRKVGVAALASAERAGTGTPRSLTRRLKERRSDRAVIAGRDRLPRPGGSRLQAPKRSEIRVAFRSAPSLRCPPRSLRS